VQYKYKDSALDIALCRYSGSKAVIQNPCAAKLCCCKRVDKRKAVPLQAWSGPEGSRKLRFPDYMTAAQDGGKVVSLTHRPPLPPGNVPGTHFG